MSTCGFARALVAPGHVGFWTFPPLVGGIRGLSVWLAPVLASVVGLHRLSPALAVALGIGFMDGVTPAGACVWSALVGRIRPSTPDPGVTAAGVGSAGLAPTSGARAVAVAVPARGACAFLGLTPVAAGPSSDTFSTPAFTAASTAGPPVLLWFWSISPGV